MKKHVFLVGEIKQFFCLFFCLKKNKNNFFYFKFHENNDLKYQSSVVKKHVFFVGEIKQIFCLFFWCFFEIETTFFYFKFHEMILNIRI